MHISSSSWYTRRYFPLVTAPWINLRPLPPRPPWPQSEEHSSYRPDCTESLGKRYHYRWASLLRACRAAAWWNLKGSPCDSWIIIKVNSLVIYTKMLGTLIETILLLINAIAILNEKRFLKKCKSRTTQTVFTLRLLRARIKTKCWHQNHRQLWWSLRLDRWGDVTSNQLRCPNTAQYPGYHLRSTGLMIFATCKHIIQSLLLFPYFAPILSRIRSLRFLIFIEEKRIEGPCFFYMLERDLLSRI